MDSRPPEKNFIPRKGIIRILSARNKHLFRTEQNFLPRKKNINLFSGRKISLDLLASKAIWNIFRALRWFCGSSQQPNPQQQPLGISPALFHLFSQKRDQFCSPAFDPVMSPDFGSPPQRSLDIFVLLLWRIMHGAGRPSAICFICAHSSSEIGVKRA